MPRIATLCTLLLLTLAATTPPAVARQEERKNTLPGPTVPHGWGVNIHFTDPQPGEMARFSEAGFGVARMDLFWNRVEREKGKYDFAAYDRLVDHLEKAGARALFILDYGNDLYEKGAPKSEQAQAAFVRFAAAAARHYQGRRVLFEIWNEPNLAQFWQPEPDAERYARLAVATAKAIKAVDPEAIVLAPGSSGFPWEFFETVFASGLLAHIDAVSIHPYRGLPPETAAADYARLRALIARHAPEEKRYLPIYSSEWGYSTVTGGLSESRQASYLARMWLANLASGVNLSVFYDWRDDGDDPKENEHRFGTVRRDFTPKPSFAAARALIDSLSGFTFRHRLKGRTEDDWQLLFQQAESDLLAVVTWSADPNTAEAAQMPVVRMVKPGDADWQALFRLASLRMVVGPLVEATGQRATLRIDIFNRSPQSVPVEASVTEAAGGVGLRLGPTTVQPRIPAVLSALVPVADLRSGQRMLSLRLLWDGTELPAIAPIPLLRVDPMNLSLAPAGREVRVFVDNPAKNAFEGNLHLVADGKTIAEKPVNLSKGDAKAEVLMPQPASGGLFEVRVVDGGGKVAARLPARRYVALGNFALQRGETSAYETVRFVENAAQKPEPVAVDAAPGGGPSSVGNALKVIYDFPPGWQYLQVAPIRLLPIPDRAVALTVWVHSDGSGDHLRSRFKDATGQTFQIDLAKLDWRGWRLLTIPLDGTRVGVYWGGANDGTLHRPLMWEGLILIDSANREKAHSGTVLLAAPYYHILP